MSILHPHWEYPESFLPIETALWWRDHSDLFFQVVMSPRYHKAVFGSELSGNLLIYPPKCDIKEDILNGRKLKRSGTGPDSSDGKSLPFQWVNVALADQDFDILERETANIEQLALAYLNLGVQRLGLAVKFDNARKSYTVSVYGSDSRNNMQPCGVSGSAPDLRDALLVLLYKFNNRLQGSFDGSTSQNTAVQSRRFR